MALTLPDGVVMDELNYGVTGGPSNLSRNGVVQLEHSTRPQFRVGNLPAGPGYTIKLGALTTAGEACAASTDFEITDKGVTRLMMTLTCGGGVVVEIEEDGEVRVSIDLAHELARLCPVVTGVSALPLDIAGGASFALEGHTSSMEGVSYAWSSLSGAFSAPTSPATEYTCSGPGEHTLTFRIEKDGCEAHGTFVAVSCSVP